MPGPEGKPAPGSASTNTKILVVVAVIHAIALTLSGRWPWMAHTPHDKVMINITRSAVGRTGPLPLALDMFKSEVGRYPTTAEGLQALVVKPDSLTTSEAARWHKYMAKSEMLKDPWNHPYGYKGPGDVNKTTYDLWSNGPDGQPGTADDIANWPQGTGG